ncbi:MAG: Long-chain-alcohol dehydrogenase 1 [Firmicutes bacterium]|nr:Long-chain-alcohol dehydrogenase 1 [Bacillota bacterium]
MKFFALPPQVHSFDTAREFWREFNIDAGDLVFTHQFIYEAYLKDLTPACEFLFYEQFGTGEPTHHLIDAVRLAISPHNYRRIIAVGGGTVADTAKFLALAGSDRTQDLLEKRAPLVKEKALIIVPTTCGTGSEVTNLAVVAVDEKETKFGLGGDAFYADSAVLIPELLVSLPYDYFFYSSVDALIHAAESLVSPRSNSYTELFSLSAIQMILASYRHVAEHGRESRFSQLRQLLVASNFAGIAFGNTGVAAVHALSYPLGGKYHVPHGESNYQFFLPVFRTYDRLRPDGQIGLLRQAIATSLALLDDREAGSALELLLGRLLPQKSLREYGMTPEEIDLFTDSVLEQQQRLLANNYVELDRACIRAIYEERY